MKKLLLLFLFIVPFALAQVDTVKVDGYTTGLSIKSALDKAVSSVQPTDTSAFRTFSNLKYQSKGTYLVPSDTSGLYQMIYSIANSLGAGLSESQVNDLIYTYLQDSSGTSAYSIAEIDSLLGLVGQTSIDSGIVYNLIYAYLQDSSSAMSVSAEGMDSALVNLQGGSTNQILSKVSGTDYHYEWIDNTGSTSWDSTYAYQRIVALETSVSNLQDSISSFRTILNSILTALDTCGCSADLSDNTPTAPPTSLVAHGGEYETQVRLTWTDPTAGDLDSIRIYRHTSNDSTGAVWIASVAENIETYTNTGRTANTTYWYWVKALDDSSNLSYFSNSDSATTLNTSGVTPFYTIDLEEGNLSEWSTTSGANLSASTTFAHTGTYSMRVGTNSFGDYTFGDKDSIYLTFWIYFPTDYSQSATTNYISLFDDGDGDKTAFGPNDANEWGIGQNSGDMNFLGSFSRNTWYKVKLYYKRGTGANAVHTGWINDTLLWTTTTGTAADPTYFLRLGSQVATITNWFYIDDIKFYNSNPGTQD